MSKSRISLGKKGEDLAVQFLEKKGYTIICRNYRTKLGEIDIIAKKDNVIVFIEVKTRQSKFLESPLVAVTAGKQKQISRVALQYLSESDDFDSEARFDVVAVDLSSKNKPQYDHIENGFELSHL